jgi:hypothetical protein
MMILKIERWMIDLGDSMGYLFRLMNKLTKQHFSFKCPMNWDEMEVSGSGRHCGKCQKHVFDLTNCSLDEVISLQKKHGAICGSISAAVVAISLSAAACQPTENKRTTGTPMPLPPKVERTRTAGVICSPEQLEKMKHRAPASAGE